MLMIGQECGLCVGRHTINKEEKIKEAKPKYLKKILLRMDF